MASSLELTLNQLQWSTASESNRRFNILAAVFLALVGILGGVIPMLELPEARVGESQALPPALARVVIEAQQARERDVPPPPPPPPEPEQPAKPSVTSDTATSRTDNARKAAEGAGILQVKDELALLREAFDLTRIDTASRKQGQAEATNASRDLIVDMAKQATDGVSLGELSQDVGGAALGAHEATTIHSGLAEQVAEEAALREEGNRRGDEQIREVVQQNLALFYTIYDRYRRQDPQLQGRLTVRLVVETDGRVSDINIVLSELNHPELEAKLLARLSLLNFGPSPHIATTLEYTLEFLPR